MTSIAKATSISHPMGDWPSAGRVSVRLLATFERSCTLILRQDSAEGRRLEQVLSVVAPEIGNGPINVVLDSPIRWADMDIGSPCSIEPGCLAIGPVEIDLRHATLWNPRPEWSVLRRDRARLLASLPKILEFALPLARPGLLHLTTEILHPTSPAAAGSAQEANPLKGTHLPAACTGIRLILDGWPDDESAITAGAAQLAGLGPGLTPAGDDFLAGLMLRSWLELDTPKAVCTTMLHVARSRTTTLSAAFLARAALGECNAAWHNFFDRLRTGTDLEQGAHSILDYGSTSGADTLAGFICLGV
jgi:hypothetical protein